MSKSQRPRKTYQPKKPPTPREENRCWDELNGLYRNCVILLASPTPVAQALRNREIIENSNDQDGLLQDSRVLMRDVTDYRNRLQEIHAKHAGKAGGTDDPTELMDALVIGEDYQNWIASFQSVVIPMVQSISENILGKNAEAPQP